MVTDASKVEAIFFTVLDIGNSQDRIAYLDKACGDDLELRRHVERLLEAHPKLGDFLDVQAVDIVATENHAITERPGTIIGRYKLLQRIGEGGFGVVFMAEQQEPVVRKVAIKIIKPGMDTREVVARFEAERQALALMDHPNIARVFDAGATDSGRPYFVMELVKGVLITEYCDRNDLSAEERLKLFASICRAVHHAHQKGIIHRDIKPSNIMVTLHDGHPVPKIIDFGVSKAISQRLTEKTLFTAYGQMIGTPQYMSPEQAEMSGLDVDTRSDVYSLGVLLYELLTGTTPLEADRLRTAGYAEMQRIIREEDPPRPSVRLSTMGERLTVVAKHRSVDGKRLQQLMRGELDWIVMKSMEKERVRRYESADSLATDVERFLTGEAVEAHPQSGPYRVRKFVRRHRAAVLTSSAVLAALVLGIFGTTIGLVREAMARAALARAYDELSQTQRATEAARGFANKAKSELETHVYSLRMTAAFQAWEDGNSIRLEDLLRQNQPNVETSAVPTFEGNFLLARQQDDQPTKTITLDAAAMHLAFSPDGTHLALGLQSGQVELYECASEKRLPLLVPDESTAADVNLCAVCFSPDGRWLVAGRGVDSAGVTDAASTGGHLYLFELPSREMTILPWTHERAVRSLAISPDSTVAASLSLDGVTKVWSIPDGTLKWENRQSNAGSICNLAFSPDADCRLLAIADEKGIGLWDIDTGQMRDRKNTDTGVNALAFSHDGRHLATSDSTGTKMWNMQSAKSSDGVRVSSERNRCLAFLPGDQSDVLAAVGIDNRMVKLSNVRRGRQTRRLIQRGWPHAFAISPDGNWLASSSDTVRLWNLKDDEKNLCLAQPTNWPALALSPDNQTAAAAGADGVVQLWNTLTGMKSVLSGHVKTVVAVAFSQTSGKLASTDTVTVRVWDFTSRSLLATFDKSGMCSVALSPNGQQLAAGTNGGITIWNLDTGDSKNVTAKGSVDSLIFTPDGRYLASSGQGETVVWNVEGNIPLCASEWPKWGGLVRSLAFSDDGTLLAVPGVEAMGLWDWLGKKQRQLSVGSTYPGAAAFSPDGATVVATSPTGEVKFWKVATGEEVGTFRIEGVRNVAIFADGHAMVTASMDGTLRVWRVSPPERAP